jgi:aminoglycoside phosphotransferase (APT) family kinase protein
VHGDFSSGNVLVANGDFWLIDFEHSHVGAPGLDVAHLYVNLLFKREVATAQDLLEAYRIQRQSRGLPVLTGMFDALTVERIAGKWNAMVSPTDERNAQIRNLFLESLAAR